ncbi:MAG: hypothetical protein QHH06_04840 [Clostridiales bacterium]|nr:hypothetical protein [Eubacteriales bacterium]MDH7565794.1 hypothetical protein [Clostridiales bacterium]
MRHIKVILFDETEKSIIDDENFPNGEFHLHSPNDEGIIDILLKVNEIILDDKVYQISSRRFSLDKVALYINVKPKE